MSNTVLPTAFSPSASGAGLLPAGWYLAQFTDIEIRGTKAGTGHYIYIVIEILSGAHPNCRGKTLFARLNYDNPNRTAVDIAEGQLIQICEALQLVELKDLTATLSRPLQVKVKITEGTGGYQDSNDVSSYKAAPPELVQAAMGGQAQAQKPAAQPQQGGENIPAWAK